MKTATTREVQHHFSKVLNWVDAGEEVVITRRGKKVARVVPIDQGDPFDREVDWEGVLEGRAAVVKELPPVEYDSVSKMRESEKF